MRSGGATSSSGCESGSIEELEKVLIDMHQRSRQEKPRCNYLIITKAYRIGLEKVIGYGGTRSCSTLAGMPFEECETTEEALKRAGELIEQGKNVGLLGIYNNNMNFAPGGHNINKGFCEVPRVS